MSLKSLTVGPHATARAMDQDDDDDFPPPRAVYMDDPEWREILAMSQAGLTASCRGRLWVLPLCHDDRGPP